MPDSELAFFLHPPSGRGARNERGGQERQFRIAMRLPVGGAIRTDRIAVTASPARSRHSEMIRPDGVSFVLRPVFLVIAAEFDDRWVAFRLGGIVIPACVHSENGRTIRIVHSERRMPHVRGTMRIFSRKSPQIRTV